MPTMLTDAEIPSVVLTHSSDDWEHDPLNPRQWPTARKWQAMTIVSFYTFIATLGSSMMAPAVPEIAEKYDITKSTILAMTLSIFFLSFALGPLFAGPLSEMYGRTWILHIGNLVHAVFNLGCAFSPNTGSLLAFRFLSGWAAAPPTAIAGGTVNDLFSDRDRAAAMAFYVAMPLIGFVVGPISGAFIAQNIGVKYVFIVMSALCGIAALICIPCLKETYAPVIRSRLATTCSDSEKVYQALPPKKESIWHILWLNLSRPVILLSHSFICFILSLYLALIYGINFLMFATFSSLFSEIYHFSPGADGLVFIGPGIGYFVATLFGAKVSNKIYSKLADKNGGKGKPEMRIPSLIIGSFFIPIGLFWYGWSAAAKIHWIMPLIGAGIFGFGYVTALLPVYLYLVDAFAFAASAVSAAAVFQSLLGFIFPLFGQDMYVKLGYGGGNSVLAGLAIIFGIPFPIWIWYKGEDIRRKSVAFLAPDVI